MKQVPNYALCSYCHRIIVHRPSPSFFLKGEKQSRYCSKRCKYEFGRFVFRTPWELVKRLEEESIDLSATHRNVCLHKKITKSLVMFINGQEHVQKQCTECLKFLGYERKDSNSSKLPRAVSRRVSKLAQVPGARSPGPNRSVEREIVMSKSFERCVVRESTQNYFCRENESLALRKKKSF